VLAQFPLLMPHLQVTATRAARETGAQHIIVAGDVRACALLLEHLDPSLRQVAAVVEDEVPADSEADDRPGPAPARPTRP
jgi:release factor family 2